MGMALGNGPERISTETVQSLCIQGTWTGTWHDKDESDAGRVVLKHDSLDMVNNKGMAVGVGLNIADEGHGRLLVTMNVAGKKIVWRGTYRREQDRLFISLKHEKGLGRWDPWSGENKLFFSLKRTTPAQ